MGFLSKHFGSHPSAAGGSLPASTATTMDGPLTAADIDHFLAHGWVKVPSCFSPSAAEGLTSTLWTRLGMSATDKSTWSKERIHMPSQTKFDAARFAPKAWAAICQLLGGEERIADWARTWSDSWIVNLGTAGGAGKVVPPHRLYDWHVDGDFFMHYLDSPEQALLVIPVFKRIRPNGGGTLICPDGIGAVARHLYDHPEGVSPAMLPRGEDKQFGADGNLIPSQRYFVNLAKSIPEHRFVEVTGEVGDVYLLHPLMLHGAANNGLREPRVITNPPVALKEPFRFDRRDGNYSVVERKTLMALGMERLEGWKITHDRERLVPERIRKQDQMKREEAKRLAGVKP